MSVNNGSTNIKGFIPGFKYVSISITGRQCSLMCEYCRGYYLRGMKSASTPKQLYDLVRQLYKEGVKGVLISGGFNKSGYLPVEPYLPTIKQIKNEFDVVVSIHTGLVNEALATKLREAKIDVVDYELVIDDDVIRNVMHLYNKKGEDFIKAYEILHKYGPPYIIPHILIGANYGKITMEFDAVNAAITTNPEILVLLILNPTLGTPMQFTEIPDVDEVIELVRYVRRVFKGQISLGCMRPLSTKQVLDNKLCELGIIDRIVNPLRSTYDRFKLSIVNSCCSVPDELLKNHGMIT